MTYVENKILRSMKQDITFHRKYKFDPYILRVKQNKADITLNIK